MSLTLITIPCLRDNYAFLLCDEDKRRAVLIDAPEPGPIAQTLRARDMTLDAILLTHHHDDHIAGVEQLRQGATVIGAKADAARLPPLDREVGHAESFSLLGQTCTVIDAPGHTIGHIAFHFPEEALLFTGDSLMAMGCGRLFEGSPEQMLSTLTRLASLPPRTRVCSGHEYTQTNLDFALSLISEDTPIQDRRDRVAKLRAEGLPSVPSTLHDENITNPFLRTGDPKLAAAVGLFTPTPLELFTELRARRDRW